MVEKELKVCNNWDYVPLIKTRWIREICPYCNKKFSIHFDCDTGDVITCDCGNNFILGEKSNATKKD